jgi:hypothetical protein
MNVLSRAFDLTENGLRHFGIVSGQKIRVVTNGAVITVMPVTVDSEVRRYGK